ncbi:hypothetical protein QYM36_012299 [Artemia franciscana]|uniref:WD repeat domain phosphoinositide-interacting protein 2 n=1 Tax=Artemia franciscana TaxID=6661 RepID=A0AA88HLC6_ARTSF|nr:hypothetical protein QYM36_012299 [Artemia franciscana]
MNLASVGGDPLSGIHFATFNQDCTSLAVGTPTGYKLYSLSATDKIDCIFDSGSDEVCIVERLFSSSLVALVTLSAPRKLKVCHFKKGTEICNYSYRNSILAVRLNRSRLVVCLEESLYIHNIRDMKVLHTIGETPSNPKGLVALSSGSEVSYLAYPGSATIGEVQIFDAQNLQAKTMIPAHDTPLAAITFTHSGRLIATASEKGTVIRVFTVTDGVKVFEFRRGMRRCATIYSLSFSPDEMLLAACSNTETVHVFRLEEPRDNRATTEEASSGWMGYLSRAVQTSASYLPANVADVLTQGRAFAQAHLQFQGLRCICALATIQKTLRLVVMSQEGGVYIYGINPQEGGECNLIKQHRLEGKSDVDRQEPLIPGYPVTSNPQGIPSEGSLKSYARLFTGVVSPEKAEEGRVLSLSLSKQWVILRLSCAHICRA